MANTHVHVYAHYHVGEFPVRYSLLCFFPICFFYQIAVHNIDTTESVWSVSCAVSLGLKCNHSQQFTSYFSRSVTWVSSIFVAFPFSKINDNVNTLVNNVWCWDLDSSLNNCMCMSFWNSGTCLFSTTSNWSSNYLPLKLVRLNSES